MGLLDDEFLTVAEVAELLKLNHQTVRNWIDAGKLPAIHAGRRVRILRSDLERFLEQGRIQAPQENHSAADAFWDGEVPEPQLEPGEQG